MELAHLEGIGLFERPSLADALGALGGALCGAEVRPETVSAPLEAPAAGGSRWSPVQLKEQLEKLPVHQLFPELCEEVMEILEKWYQRLPLKVWSRMMKICKGSAHQVPSVLKELTPGFERSRRSTDRVEGGGCLGGPWAAFQSHVVQSNGPRNESAPVIQRVREWIEALPSSSPKACILDLGAGYGFLSMLLAELLPPEKVKEFCLMDMSYPNMGVDNSSGSTSVEHIYKLPWPIPMYTLKVDLKKKNTLNQIAERLLHSEDLRSRPIFALGLRAAQLFNENAEVAGFAFVPCCFPTSRHVTQQVVYQLGRHRFAAKDFLDPKVVPSNTDRFQRWAEHILEGIEVSGAEKRLERHELHRPTNGMFAQNLYLFAERPLESSPIEVDVRGTAIVVDAKFGHGKAKMKAQRRRENTQGSEIEPEDLAHLERILAPSLSIAPSSISGLGLHARRACVPGTDLASERAFVWCGASRERASKGFNASDIFPKELLTDPDHQSCALTAVLCLMHTRLTTASIGVWFRVTSRGPRHWLSPWCPQRRWLERRCRVVRKLLQEASFRGTPLSLKISDEEIASQNRRF
eukprot:g18291.t1